jgi:hypothetical protein
MAEELAPPPIIRWMSSFQLRHYRECRRPIRRAGGRGRNRVRDNSPFSRDTDPRRFFVWYPHLVHGHLTVTELDRPSRTPTQPPVPLIPAKSTSEKPNSTVLSDLMLDSTSQPPTSSIQLTVQSTRPCNSPAPPVRISSPIPVDETAKSIPPIDQPPQPKPLPSSSRLPWMSTKLPCHPLVDQPLRS